MPITPLPLTIIILAHRNDERLQTAVESAAFADEILIVDPHDVINVRPLNKIHEVKRVVIPVPAGKSIDFAALRNESLTQAKHEWIFFLDSDEIITKESIKEVKHIIDENAVSAIYVKRIDIFHDYEMKWGEVGNLWLLRFGKRQALKFIRPVHEIAQFSGNIKYAAIRLRHHSHLTVSDFLQKITRYAQLDAQYRVQFRQPFQFLELVLFPPGKFLYNYVFQFGFLDGWRGLVYAVMMSLHSLYVRVYQYQLETTSK